MRSEELSTIFGLMLFLKVAQVGPIVCIACLKAMESFFENKKCAFCSGFAALSIKKNQNETAHLD